MDRMQLIPSRWDKNKIVFMSLLAVMLVAALSAPAVISALNRGDRGYTISQISKPSIIYSTLPSRDPSPSWKQNADKSLIIQFKTWRDCTPSVTMSTDADTNDLHMMIRATYAKNDLKTCIRKDHATGENKSDLTAWKQWKIVKTSTSDGDDLKHKIITVTIDDGVHGAVTTELIQWGRNLPTGSK